MAEEAKNDAPASPAPTGHDELMGALKQGRFKGARQRMSMLHLVVVANTVILIVVIAVFMWAPWRHGAAAQAPELPPVAVLPSGSPPTSKPAPIKITIPQAAPEAPAVSCQTARLAMQQKRYPAALEQYELLYQAATRAEDPAMADYFRLRQAHCLKHLGRRDAARNALVPLQDSTSPAIRAWACHDLAVISLAEGQFLQARTKSYASIAALHLLKPSNLESDCDFIIGRSLTGRAITGDTCTIRWPETNMVQTLDSIDESALRGVLSEGARKFSDVLPAPVVRKVDAVNWKVACLKAPLEEFLARLSAQAGTEIAFQDVAPAARTRPVTMFEESAGIPRVCEIAGGMAGLVARYDGRKVTITDPQTIPSVQQQTAVLRDEAVAHWRRVCLRYPADGRIAKVNFTMAGLMESGGDLNNAMTQYLLTAGRFERDSVAPQALLRSSKIRISLRDYPGARDTLLNLLNTYPDIPEIEQVYLALGQSTMNAGLPEEAADVFSRLYYRELSLSSRTAACLGAGQCFHKLGKYEQACTWLARYIRLGREQGEADLRQAHLLLGASQAAREKWQDAAAAYHQCIRSGATGADRLEAVIGFAKAQARQGNYASALGMVRRLDRESLTSAQRASALVLEGQVLRGMSLPQEAAEMLNREMATVDKADQLALKRELAVAQVEASLPDLARQTYVEVLPSLKAPECYQVAMELAQLCLKQERLPETQTLCQGLIAGAAPDAVKARAKELLAQALVKSQQYKQAVSTLTGGKT